MGENPSPLGEDFSILNSKFDIEIRNKFKIQIAKSQNSVSSAGVFGALSICILNIRYCFMFRIFFALAGLQPDLQATAFRR